MTDGADTELRDQQRRREVALRIAVAEVIVAWNEHRYQVGGHDRLADAMAALITAADKCRIHRPRTREDGSYIL